MTQVVIYGASDDLVEVEFVDERQEEFDAYNKVWRGELYAPSGDALYVYAEFGRADAADWTLWVENSHTWPSWPIHFTDRPGREGDPAIIIEVPEGTTIKEID